MKLAGQQHIDLLRSQFACDYATGALCRKYTTTGPKPMSQLGSPNGGGYHRTRFMGHKVYSHVLVWAHFHGSWPSHSVDHIDGNPSNNAICNLREATHAENCRNRRVKVTNKLGVKGVCWDKRLKQYRVQLVVNGDKVFQQICATLEEACAAYKLASETFHGKFGRQ